MSINTGLFSLEEEYYYRFNTQKKHWIQRPYNNINNDIYLHSKGIELIHALDTLEKDVLDFDLGETITKKMQNLIVLPLRVITSLNNKHISTRKLFWKEFNNFCKKFFISKNPSIVEQLANMCKSNNQELHTTITKKIQAQSSLITKILTLYEDVLIDVLKKPRVKNKLSSYEQKQYIHLMNTTIPLQKAIWESYSK